MSIVYLGLDPGKAGFITAYDGIEFNFYPMPTHKVDGKTEFHITGLKDLAYKIRKDYPFPCTFKGWIEEVGGRGGWSATNNFNFGFTAGLQRMVFEMLGAEITLVRPQKWQAEMRKGYKNMQKSSASGKTMVNDAKAMAEHIATTEFDWIDFRKSTRARNNDDNKIDSFLICLYGYRRNQ